MKGHSMTRRNAILLHALLIAVAAGIGLGFVAGERAGFVRGWDGAAGAFVASAERSAPR